MVAFRLSGPFLNRRLSVWLVYIVFLRLCKVHCRNLPFSAKFLFLIWPKSYCQSHTNKSLKLSLSVSTVLFCTMSG